MTPAFATTETSTSTRTPGKIKLYFYSPELRSDRAQSPEVNYRPTKNYSLGYQKERLNYLIEYQENSDNSAAGVTQILRSHQELLAWLTYHFAQYSYLSFYSGMGGGAYKEILTTKFNNTVYVDTIPVLPMFALNTGIETHISVFGAKDLLIAATEVQALFGETFDPGPNIALLFKAGISF